MSNDQNLHNRSNIKSTLDDILGLISEYPNLALPVGVVLALFGLATVFKTLIDGFAWAYEAGQIWGVVLVGGIIASSSVITILLVRYAIAPRPVIQPFPAHHLSRSPIIKWDDNTATPWLARYRLDVEHVATGEVTRIVVPERMYQIAIPQNITGALEISVYRWAGEQRRRSRTLETEIYSDSVQRIRHTGKLRVAIHSDPAEEIFCYFRNGRWEGLDIDFTELIASELQQDPAIGRPIKAEYLFFEWPAIISAPNQHEVDMAIASITISAERSKKYRVYFSVPYAESGLGIIAHSRAFEKAPGDSVNLHVLKGKTVAAHKETIALAFIEGAKLDHRYDDIGVQIAENNDELRELLRDNQVDAVVHDHYRAYTLLEAGLAVYRLDHDLGMQADQYGVAFSRVNISLLSKVDAIVAQHRNRIRTAPARRVEDRRRATQLGGSGSEDPDHPPICGAINLFVYGSLMYREVWKRLIDRDFECHPARLSGYRRLRIKNEDYPGLVRGIGTVSGRVWLGLDEQTVRRLDRFEAECYRRVSGFVIDDAGGEVPADFFVIKESHRAVLEDAEWDADDFRRRGLTRFINSYAGFRAAEAEDVEML